MNKAALKQTGLRIAMLLALCVVALQLTFAVRIVCMTMIDPQSTSFQRSEIWRLLVDKHELAWSQEWVDQAQISSHLKRAVIASEDAGFTEHAGVEWDAIEGARLKNANANRKAQQGLRNRAPKVVGGSTISQQLAKNLLLSGERTALRKGQEFIITVLLETFLPKQRILEIYLNSVEWGEGIFGAQAAAQHYFRTDAAKLSAEQAARLAVLLPSPKRSQRSFSSSYVAGRAAVIMARMAAVELP